MRLYALILALAVFYARAATIPVEVEKSEPVDVEQKGNIESKLRNEPEAIPVAIVEDANPTPKRVVDENSNDYVPDEDTPSINIKRLEIDLKNPGPPQRQEHETQNPEVFVERDYFVADIKKKLLETENIFKKSVSQVNEGFVNWVPNSEHLKVIQSDLKEMQNKFLTQLSSLNKSLQAYLHPQSTKSVIVDPESTASLKEVENRLKVLEVNFKAGVRTLSEGVKALENMKADGESPAPTETGSNPAPSPGNGQSPSNNPFGQIFQFFTNGIGDAINNMQNAFQSFTNPSSQNNPGSTDAPPAGAQSDETSKPPSWFESLQSQVNQWFKPETNPLFQAFQNPFQGIIDQFTPTTKATQATSPSSGQSTTPSSSQSTTPSTDQSTTPSTSQSTTATSPQNDQPASLNAQPQRPPAAAAQSDAQLGPIRQIVQNNPIVKGIVQRIQSISNPEKPRDQQEQAAESVKPEEPIKDNEHVAATKGHGGGGFNNVNGGATTGGADNDSDGVVVKNVPLGEKIEEEPHKCEKEKEAEAASDKDEKQAVLPDKTE